MKSLLARDVLGQSIPDLFYDNAVSLTQLQSQAPKSMAPTGGPTGGTFGPTGNTPVIPVIPTS